MALPSHMGGEVKLQADSLLIRLEEPPDVPYCVSVKFESCHMEEILAIDYRIIFVPCDFVHVSLFDLMLLLCVKVLFSDINAYEIHGHQKAGRRKQKEEL
ncbi:hypothetical protein L2E82_25586 [Cichorium intybus]|uniref:Uncharacterized protein n=1 Tax=Cichorium intybus TaxID=13427 RepID=A0ACB9E477_CICIN|nr:hypothetical protein L2E82_25586 [Cichorium intybus]